MNLFDFFFEKECMVLSIEPVYKYDKTIKKNGVWTNTYVCFKVTVRIESNDTQFFYEFICSSKFIGEKKIQKYQTCIFHEGEVVPDFIKSDINQPQNNKNTDDESLQ